MSMNYSSKKGIFVRHNVEFSPRGFTPKGPITQLRVQNEVMLVACRGRILQHVRLQNDKCTDIALPLSSVDRIAYIHTDYNGTHAIVSSTAGDNYYLDMKNLVFKPLRRLKGMNISAVGWNLDYAKDSETAFIVLGTTKGAILETNITSSGTMNYLKNLTSNLNQDGKELAITDLHLHQCSENEDDRFLLLVCMPGRLYALCGTANLNAVSQQQPQAVVGTVWSSVMVEQPQTAVLQPLFNFGEARPRYQSHSEENTMLPSALAVYPITLNESPSKYCWMSAEGLSLGTVDTTKENGSGGKRAHCDASDMLVEGAHLKHKRVEGRFDYPLDIALTEHHVVLLYSTRIVAICLLDQSVAFEEPIEGSSKVVGMTRDASSQFVWVFAESALFKYRPFEETSSSLLKQAIENDSLTFPAPANLPRTQFLAPFFFFGNGAFPLPHYMMKPFGATHMDHDERIYNYRISQARNHMENTFGLLAMKWRVLLKPIECSHQMEDEIAWAIYVLHNFLKAEMREDIDEDQLLSAFRRWRELEAEVLEDEGPRKSNSQ